MGQKTEMYTYTTFLPVTPNEGYIKMDHKETRCG
jgi:hypothetical protein